MNESNIYRSDVGIDAPVSATSDTVETPMTADTSATAETPLTPAEEIEAAELRAEIEATREEMSGTLGAIGDRLDPERLMPQAKETVRGATIGKVEDAVTNAGETAKGAGLTMWQTIKQNPIPAAMAGIGLWWLYQSRSSTQGQQGGYRYAGSTAYDGYQGGYGGAYPAAGYASGTDGGQSPVDAAGQVAGQAAGQVKQTAGDVVGTVAGTVTTAAGTVAGTVQNVATQAVWQTQGVVQQASTQLGRTMRENPLALAAVATGAGVAVGLLVPETPHEHRLMGEARDTVVERTGEVVNETMDKVRQVTDRAETAVMEKVEEKGLVSSGVNGGGSSLDGGTSEDLTAGIQPSRSRSGGSTESL